jgi:hypothetical protein
VSATSALASAPASRPANRIMRNAFMAASRGRGRNPRVSPIRRVHYRLRSCRGVADPVRCGLTCREAGRLRLLRSTISREKGIATAAAPVRPLLPRHSAQRAATFAHVRPGIAPSSSAISARASSAAGVPVMATAAAVWTAAVAREPSGQGWMSRSMAGSRPQRCCRAPSR